MATLFSKSVVGVFTKHYNTKLAQTLADDITPEPQPLDTHINQNRTQDIN